MSEITEITDIRRSIARNEEAILKYKDLIIRTEDGIKQQYERISELEILKQQDTFVYDPLIKGKIGHSDIEKIRIYGCSCLDNIPCDGTHQIHIYGFLETKRLNFNNERKFTTAELESLNYIDKITQTVLEGRPFYKLRSECKFYQQYPNKLVQIWDGC